MSLQGLVFVLLKSSYSGPQKLGHYKLSDQNLPQKGNLGVFRTWRNLRRSAGSGLTYD